MDFHCVDHHLSALSRFFCLSLSTINDDSARTNGQGTSVKPTVSLSVVISSLTVSSYYYKL